MHQKIIDIIEKSGPMAIDKFMKLTLAHYYAQEKVFGVKGDFITAPEISQMFGEIVAAWSASQWMRVGMPKFNLVEFGPGRGVMMADFLRATKNMVPFHDSIEKIILVENSPTLRDVQKNTLIEHVEKLVWINDVEQVPEHFSIILANEFFDALPIKQFYIENGDEKERLIGLLNDELVFLGGDKIFELSEESLHIALHLAKLIRSFGGVLFIADYGYLNGEEADTLQALKAHKYHDVLKEVGTADITAHVDFKRLSDMFRIFNLKPELATQRDFLMLNGIMQRAEILAKSNPDVTRDLQRLIAENQMGTLFKVLTLVNDR